MNTDLPCGWWVLNTNFTNFTNIFGYTDIILFSHRFQMNTDFTVRMVVVEHESHESHEYFFAHRKTADFTMRMN